MSPETLARLHAPADGVNDKDPLENYACGWVVLRRDWAGGTGVIAQRFEHDVVYRDLARPAEKFLGDCGDQHRGSRRGARLRRCGGGDDSQMAGEVIGFARADFL